MTRAARAPLVVAPIRFDYDAARVRPDQAGAVAEAAGGLKAHRRATVVLVGHCDERGTLEYNLALGQRRAESVKAYLVRLGVRPERMTCETMGEEAPAAAGHDEAAWAANRRVEFEVTE